MKRFLDILTTVALVLLALIMFACGPSEEQKAQELTDAAAKANEAVAQTFSTVAIEAAYPDIAVKVSLTDSLFHAELITEPVANLFLAKYLQLLPAGDCKPLISKVKAAQGVVKLTFTDLYGQSFSADLAAEHVLSLFTAKFSQLNTTAVKEDIASMIGLQIEVPERFKLAGDLTTSFESGFITVVLPVKPIDVANLSQGNVVFYHQPLINNQWKNLEGFASILKDLGIDGIRVTYADVESDKQVKQAFPWRSIFEE